ncbi:Vitamin B12 ABC transporter, B12-binding component BtuF [Enhygromyxa salina]|uniref:Vitamin B12 ABC transporter, B12-binding component BtuF n=1 Tax=Enhygromyxa salina TaxID=215803 RepID=A0A0C2CX94_9BACT|nr:ABC transporter substrate-binding protein [Enhygromyxa salina]KIG14220.1 Vitamin B12 ABC transporter, B12-binding component BtuF [Enhygromyxa salina]
MIPPASSSPFIALSSLGSLSSLSSLGRLLLALCISLTLAACRGDAARESTAAKGPAKRIASRTVFADEVLWQLGEEVQARVVGLSPMADDARYSTVAGRWPASTPRVGQNPEELLALAPDLVIVASFSAPEYRAAIEDKVRVLVLEDFTGFDDYLANLAQIGEASGATEAAGRMRDRFVARRAKLEAARPPVDQRPTIIAWDYGYVPGAQTSFDDAATTAGFVNLAAREGLEGHQRLDAEQLVAWDPAWIVVGCGELPCAEARSKLAAQPGLGKLNAVAQGQIITIPAPYLATTGEDMLELAARLQAPLLGAHAK